MKAVAIIVEYNPFHNGHLHQLQTVKEIFPDKTIIIILNGDFLQRGEPALLNKWHRTKWALEGGADLVVELPFVFGTQRADIFAEGGVRIATMLGATTLCYGIEEPITDELSVDEMSPNQRLGFFYKQKIAEFAPWMDVYEIKRIHSSYNEQSPQHDSIASATAIRRMLKTSDPKIHNFIPDFVYEDLIKYKDDFTEIADYYPHLQRTVLLQETPTIPALLTHGAYLNVQKGLVETDDYKTFFEFIHHKHMSRTHTQRALTYLLTSTTHELLDRARYDVWSRVLGYSENGRKYLRIARNAFEDKLRLIQKPQHLQEDNYMLQYNSAVASTILRKQSLKKALKREFDQRPITRIENKE